MVDNKVKESLYNIYLSMPKESLFEKGDGWVKGEEFTKAVKKARINIKILGYTWCSELLEDTGIFVFCTEQNIPYVNMKLDLKRRNTQRMDILSENSKDAEKIKLKLRLENNQFIGQFTPQKNEGCYTITDIRNTDFTKIEDEERGVKICQFHSKAISHSTALHITSSHGYCSKQIHSSSILTYERKLHQYTPKILLAVFTRVSCVIQQAQRRR